MSLSADRPLSQAMRYAQHRKNAPTATAKLGSAAAFSRFAGQFEPPMRDRLNAVYNAELDGPLVEDRRSREKQVW